MRLLSAGIPLSLLVDLALAGTHNPSADRPLLAADDHAETSLLRGVTH